MAVQTLPTRSEVPAEMTWDLESIFPTPEAWEKDFTWVNDELPKLSAYEGKLSDNAQTLYEALDFDSRLSEVLGRLAVYASMRADEDTANQTNQAREARINMLGAKAGAATAFLTPEILAIPQERLESFLREEPRLELYRHTLDELLRRKPHVRSAEVEALLAEASETLYAPAQIFGMINDADLKLPIIKNSKGEDVQLSKGNYILYMEDRDRRVRKDAFEGMHGTFYKQRNTLAATLNGHVKSQIFRAKARRYNSAIEAALDANNIPVSVYENLLETVRNNIGVLNRYLALRKRVLGLEDLHMYDLYVPIVAEVEYKVRFEQAKETVAKALAALGKDYVEDMVRGFNSRWIDVLENEGKRGGAYSSGTYGTHPFVLLNYQENLDNMFTLAHEFGHSMHSFYTRRTQPYPYGDYTIFVAEVASTLNEALLTHYLLETVTDKPLRMYIINHYLEGFRATLYRQTLFADFERQIHAMAEAGEALTAESLSKVYKDLNVAYYGGETNVDDLTEIEWARIPHFYYNFYVYQYATGISASAALAQQIVTEGQPAVERYRRFLTRGSSDYSINLLRDAGVDMTSSAPVQQALELFGRYVGEMEKLV
ncbi:MAG TPA: oligoendopeptidase F [Ktedonobacterales bacterium]|nr:oligoendopeptidase F [Ktedonobacterales bacterium]